MAKHETPQSGDIHFFARARFLRLEEPKAFEEGQKARWEATFLLDPADVKGAEGVKAVLSEGAKLCKEHYGKVPLAIKKLAAKYVPGSPKVDLNDPANADDGIKVPFSDGDDEKFSEYGGYQGMLVLPAHNSRLKPAVAGRTGKKVQPGDEQYPYDGCYVVGCVRYWLQTGATEKKYGRRLGVNLRGVQYHSKGDPFTQDVIDAEDTFQALEDATESTSEANPFD